MATFSFKSVGDLKIDRDDQRSQIIRTDIPLGIKTPVRVGSGGHIFETHRSLPDQIRDNLKNLLLTNHGERLGRYTFGANLNELSLEIVNGRLEEAMIRIKQAVERHMPYVLLKNFETEREREGNAHVGRIRIRVTYDLPALSVSDQGVDVILFIGG